MRRQPGLVLTEAEIFLIPVTCVTCVSQGRGRKRGEIWGQMGRHQKTGPQARTEGTPARKINTLYFLTRWRDGLHWDSPHPAAESQRP